MQPMLLALQLAERGRYSVSPNPMVGCVIIKNNKIIGSGFHEKAGGHHAEIHALNEAKLDAKNATLYVTLEPCAHHGRTPPCVDAIIKAGIKKVIVACLDPNPLVSGKGIEILREAGIEVEVGQYHQDAEKLNEIFFHYITKKRPFVISKWAMSLDGKTITSPSDTRQISCAKSQENSHDLRRCMDAILVGANTVRCDNPSLTARSKHEIITKQPLRIVLASHGELSASARIFSDNEAKTLVVTTKNHYQHLPSCVEICVVPENEKGVVDLSLLLDELGRREITSLLVEGGMNVHQQFLRQNLVNKIHVYLAPVIIGENEKKFSVPHVDIHKIAQDFHFVAEL